MSFLARGESPIRIARAVSEAARSLRAPSGALIFASGALALALEEFGRYAREALGPIPALIVGGHGVLTERAEVEGESAAAGLLWEGIDAEPLVLAESEGKDLGLALAELLQDRAAPTTTAFVFVRPRGMAPHTLEPLKSLRFGALVGGGTAGDQQVVALNPGRAPVVGNAGALLLRGARPPVVRSSPACRLLTPLGRITATRGPMVLEIDGQRALDVLSSCTRSLEQQPLLFVALAEESNEDDDPPPLLLRGIQGVDPIRQAIVVSEEVRPGLRMAFAVRDPLAARADFEATTARLGRETAGAAPRLGVYLSCVGRGSGLYGAAEVDTRIIRSRFGDLPLAGMQSSFEIAPHGGEPTLQLYTGVLAVFTAPS
jgi:small ligand-binding sensory domain FIST